jgi:peptidoglycan/xylan/chitin deacetylase (PgdA/CDA1 family)
MASERSFRVVIFSYLAPYALMQLISRIHTEVPEAHVCGVLYGNRARGKPLRRRVLDFVRNLRSLTFLRYAIPHLCHAFLSPLSRLSALALRLVHASPPRTPPAENFGLDDLSAFCATCDCRIFFTDNMHADESLQFVHDLRPDLGLVYSAPILKPVLFEIPRLGSINIHQRKLPDYRGGGPIALWELLDGQTEIGVTVHRVAQKVDTGAIVNATTIPIEPFDTLRSLGLKADIVGCDLLVRSVADYARGTAQERPQQGAGKTYRNPQPQDLRLLEKQVTARRPAYAVRGRPAWKLLLRSLAFLPYLAVRNWVRRFRGSFPVIVFYHHVITDRPHCDGIPTDLFLEHVRYLQRHYRVVDLGEAVEMLKAGRVEEPTVVLTFDDGYQDNYLGLRAVTGATGVPVTLFVCSENIEKRRAFDHDTKRGQPGFWPLTWEEVKALDRRGLRIGSHTRSHFNCGSTDPVLLEHEIVGSKDDLETQLGHEVSTFSFPWGLPSAMSAAAINLAHKTYPCVCSAYGGANYVTAKDRHWHVRRYPHPDGVWELELTIQSILEFNSHLNEPLALSDSPQGESLEPSRKPQEAVVNAF